MILGDTNILDFLDELVENPPPAAEIANTGRSATNPNVNATKPKASYKRSNKLTERVDAPQQVKRARATISQSEYEYFGGDACEDDDEEDGDYDAQLKPKKKKKNMMIALLVYSGVVQVGDYFYCKDDGSKGNFSVKMVNAGKPMLNNPITMAELLPAIRDIVVGQGWQSRHPFLLDGNDNFLGFYDNFRIGEVLNDPIDLKNLLPHLQVNSTGKSDMHNRVVLLELDNFNKKKGITTLTVVIWEAPSSPLVDPMTSTLLIPGCKAIGSRNDETRKKEVIRSCLEAIQSSIENAIVQNKLEMSSVLVALTEEVYSFGSVQVQNFQKVQKFKSWIGSKIKSQLEAYFKDHTGTTSFKDIMLKTVSLMLEEPDPLQYEPILQKKTTKISSFMTRRNEIDSSLFMNQSSSVICASSKTPKTPRESFSSSDSKSLSTISRNTSTNSRNTQITSKTSEDFTIHQQIALISSQQEFLAAQKKAYEDMLMEKEGGKCFSADEEELDEDLRFYKSELEQFHGNDGDYCKCPPYQQCQCIFNDEIDIPDDYCRCIGHCVCFGGNEDVDDEDEDEEEY